MCSEICVNYNLSYTKVDLWEYRQSIIALSKHSSCQFYSIREDNVRFRWSYRKICCNTGLYESNLKCRIKLFLKKKTTVFRSVFKVLINLWLLKRFHALNIDSPSWCLQFFVNSDMFMSNAFISVRTVFSEACVCSCVGRKPSAVALLTNLPKHRPPVSSSILWNLLQRSDMSHRSIPKYLHNQIFVYFCLGQLILASEPANIYVCRPRENGNSCRLTKGPRVKLSISIWRQENSGD